MCNFVKLKKIEFSHKTYIFERTNIMRQNNFLENSIWCYKINKSVWVICISEL